LIMILITFMSGISLLLFVLTISLIFLFLENKIFHIDTNDGHVFDLYERLLRGDCAGKCPPPCLYISCLCLLMVFTLLPMGALPQFIETRGDIFVIMILIASAQSFYIRGMRKYSGKLYQSLDTKELYMLSRLIVVLIITGGTLSWYALYRGMPGNIFSINTFGAMSLWNVTGNYGKLGILMFVILLAVVSPCRRSPDRNAASDIPLPEIFDAVRSTIIPAMTVSVFFPFRYGVELGLLGFTMYAVDFILYWFKVFVFQIFVLPFIYNIYMKAKSRLPEHLNLSIAIIIAVSAVALFMLDLYV